MTDTSTETIAYIESRYRDRSQGQRVEMACAMFMAGVALATAGLLAAEPALDDTELRVRLLHRLYDGELPADALAAITARIRAAGPSRAGEV